MTVKTEAQLEADIASLFADNTSGDITASTVRTFLTDLNDTVFAPIAVSYWDEIQRESSLVGLWKMDESSGDLADSAGGVDMDSHSGVTYGEASIIPSLSDTSVLLSATSGYAHTASLPAALQGDTDLTMIVWHRPATGLYIGSSERRMVSFDPGFFSELEANNVQFKYAWDYRVARPKLFWEKDSGSNVQTNLYSTDVALMGYGAPQMHAVTKESSGAGRAVEHYLNGYNAYSTSYASGDEPTGGSGCEIHIGSDDEGSSGLGCIGHYQGLALFDSVLSAERIAELYAIGLTGFKI
jgi:hypothetical protein